MPTQAAQASIETTASLPNTWKGLTNPEILGRSFFGSQVQTSWVEGSSIRFRGDWRGKPFEDKGEIRTFSAPRQLSFTHWSGLSGTADRPENYHLVRFDLSPVGNRTRIQLTQENANDAPVSEDARRELTKNWTTILQGLKQSIEATYGKRSD